VFSKDAHGDDLSESVWRPRVLHVLRVLNSIIADLGSRGLRPVFAGKAHDDRIQIGLWKSPKNPPVIIEVAGWRVEWFQIELGSQCLKGFDPELAEITDLSAWAPSKPARKEVRG
jgi:hypothetical protein